MWTTYHVNYMRSIRVHNCVLQFFGVHSRVLLCTPILCTQNYVYEPTGDAPLRFETDVPGMGMIESLCTMPMDDLLEEFRDNKPYESTKEPKSSLVPRSPLIQIN